MSGDEYAILIKKHYESLRNTYMYVIKYTSTDCIFDYTIGYNESIETIADGYVKLTDIIDFNTIHTTRQKFITKKLRNWYKPIEFVNKKYTKVFISQLSLVSKFIFTNNDIYNGLLNDNWLCDKSSCIKIPDDIAMYVKPASLFCEYKKLDIFHMTTVAMSSMIDTSVPLILNKFTHYTHIKTEMIYIPLFDTSYKLKPLKLLNLLYPDTLTLQINTNKQMFVYDNNKLVGFILPCFNCE